MTKQGRINLNLCAMESNFIKKLSTQLADGLAELEAKQLQAEKHLSTVLQLVRRLLSSLREEVLRQPFQDQESEIHFFKQIKPRFLAAGIFELERYDLEQSKPVGTTEKLLAFYEGELEIVRRFFGRYAYLYQYYRKGLTELDTMYFVRGAAIPAVFLPEFGEADPQFSTYGDYLFAKFAAFERLQDYIVKSLGRLDPAIAVIQNRSKDLPELKWTGDKVNLVEVIYALYFTGQLNNGNADIALIVQFMEKHLQIDLSRAYRDFIDIRNRKVSSPTRYIDQMRESIHKRIDEDLALKKSARERWRSGN